VIIRSPEVECRNCGREVPRLDVDRQFWCADCRDVVVSRATVWARLSAVAVTVGVIIWISTGVLTTQRFLVLWMLMVAAIYLLVYKIVRRIAFEVIRSRGVPPPEPDA
jgi:hypothetical protein